MGQKIKKKPKAKKNLRPASLERRAKGLRDQISNNYAGLAFEKVLKPPEPGPGNPSKPPASASYGRPAPATAMPRGSKRLEIDRLHDLR
jgi:hypothetical protein